MRKEQTEELCDQCNHRIALWDVVEMDGWRGFVLCAQVWRPAALRPGSLQEIAILFLKASGARLWDVCKWLTYTQATSQTQEEQSEQRACSRRRCFWNVCSLFLTAHVTPLVLNLLFPLSRRLIAAIFTLLTLPLQLPDHTPICNCNKRNGSGGKCCSA